MNQLFMGDVIVTKVLPLSSLLSIVVGSKWVFLSSPLLSFAHFFVSPPSPSTLHEYIIRRHWLTGWCWDAVASPLRPLLCFHPSIPHTFQVVIEFGWLPVPWITLPPGSLFSLSAGRIFHPFSTPATLSVDFLFTSPFFTLFSLPLFLPMQVSVFLCLSISYSLPRSPPCAQEV